MATNIEKKIRDLEARISAQEPIARFIIRTQLEQLAQAEELRKRAKALVKSQWQHRCKKDRAGGCTAVSESALWGLEELLTGMLPFHLRGRIPKGVRELIGKRP
jgi:hypothetical protein